MMSPVILAWVGFAVAVAGRVYHYTVHPEWTEPQAHYNLLWVWLLAAGLGGVSVGLLFAKPPRKRDAS